MENLPQTQGTSTPAEVLNISPEALEIANCYLQVQDIGKVADDLEIPRDLVTQTLQRREVKAYVDQVFMNLGFNNRFKLRGVMDAIIKKKLQDMDESETGSNKDIIEILTLSHKMSMDELDRQIALEKLRQGNSVKTQTNIQINDTASGGTNYGNLLSKLLDQGNIIDAR